MSIYAYISRRELPLRISATSQGYVNFDSFVYNNNFISIVYSALYIGIPNHM